MPFNFIRLLMMIGASFFVLFRKASFVAGKLSTGMLVSKLKKGEIPLTKISDDLDIPYRSLPGINEAGFQMLGEKIKEGMLVGGYRILYSGFVNNEQFLVLTELSYGDFDIGLSGNAVDVKKKAFHNFVLKFDSIKSEVAVYSTLYDNATDKFQKEDFLRKL